MSQASPLIVERREDGVTVLTLNRPEVHNAFDWRAMDIFAEAVSGIAADTDAAPDAVGAVVVAGAGGRAFSSGGDLRALRHAVRREDGARVAATMGDALIALEHLPVPVLAAVDGYAVGGGAEIALACDLRFVSRTARLGLVHLGLAEVPGWGGGTRLVRLVGHARAARMLLEARAYDAAELSALGVADYVVPAGHALESALALAGRLAAADRAAVRAIKALLLAARSRERAGALAFERSLFVDLWPAAAHVEAMRAFGSPDRS